MRLHVSQRLIDNRNGITFDRDGTVVAIGTPEPHDWTVGCQDSRLRIEDLASVTGQQFNIAPDRKYIVAISAVSQLRDFPLKWSMPSSVYRDYLRRLQDESWDVLESYPMEYYHNHFVSTSDLLRALKPAKIDVDRHQQAIRAEMTPGQRSVLISFTPDDNGFARPVTYNQHGSRTGRLTERSGPQILRLRKDLRDIIGSRFDGGEIYQVDFVSLEARIAAAVGGLIAERDVYNQVARDVFDNMYSRDQVKLACLSVIYGAGPKRLSSQLGVSRLEANLLITKISSTFGVQERARELLGDATTNDRISNHFGRVLTADDKASHVLYNNFIQSTGVDVAMSGFRKIIDMTDTSTVVPIFLLHDAIIFDVHPNHIVDLTDISSGVIDIDGFDTPFYVDVSKF
jgi:hypothetical protein